MQTLKLRDVVRERLEEAKLQQREFAESEFLNYDDFRMQLVRNSFSQAALKAIVKLLNEPSVESLKNKFEFNSLKKTKSETVTGLEIVQERLQNWFRPEKEVDLVHNLATLYARLGEGDLVTVCSLNEPPVESDWAGWDSLGSLYVRAVKNGANFLYIRPDQSVVNSYPKRLTKQFFKGFSPQDDVQSIRNDVIENGVSKKDAEARIRLYSTDICPFWMVGVRLGFYSVVNNDGPRRTALFLRFPFGGSLSGDADDNNIILLANKQMRDAFQAYLADCFNRVKSLADLKPTVSSQI
jgi:hypothetical protein